MKTIAQIFRFLVIAIFVLATGIGVLSFIFLASQPVLGIYALTVFFTSGIILILSLGLIALLFSISDTLESILAELKRQSRPVEAQPKGAKSKPRSFDNGNDPPLSHQ